MNLFKYNIIQRNTNEIIYSTDDFKKAEKELTSYKIIEIPQSNKLHYKYELYTLKRIK